MKLFKELVKKHGLGFVLGYVTLDGYRRQVLGDRDRQARDEFERDKSLATEAQREEMRKIVEEKAGFTKNVATIGRYKEAADEHQKARDKYNVDPSQRNLDELNRANKKLDESYGEVNKLSSVFESLYNKYNEFLDSLSVDKIVSLFNIIVDGLLLSSFFSVLSVMLSESVINKIRFLDKYPRILKFLKLRSDINKKVAKIYLLMHFIIIISCIIANIYMFIF